MGGKDNNQELEIVAFGGGCFWCTEAVFLELKGVVAVTPGYAGGSTGSSTEAHSKSSPQAAPTYEQVSTGETGHAEVIQIEYDPKIIAFDKLLEVFFMSHDPTSLNRQGNDIGTQYRSILLYTIDKQRQEAENYIKNLSDEKKYSKPMVTEIVRLDKFYPAEEYHKQYYSNHPDESYSEFIIKPKLDKLRQKHPELLKMADKQ